MLHKGKFRCVGMSDTGRIREHNEDTIGTDADIGLVVLADGMGGYKAGEVASGIAVRTVMSLVKEAVEREDLSLRDAGDRHEPTRHPAARRHPSRQQDHLPDGEDAGQLRGHGHDGRGRPVLRRQADGGARRRLAAVLPARQRVPPGHAGSLAAAGTGRARLLHARGGAPRGGEELRHPRARESSPPWRWM